MWEFPGGKLDGAESPAEAAGRELLEELSLEVVGVEDRLLSVQDGDSPFVIEFFRVSVLGEAEALEHSEVGWFDVDELRSMPLAPADAKFVDWYATVRQEGSVPGR